MYNNRIICTIYTILDLDVKDSKIHCKYSHSLKVRLKLSRDCFAEAPILWWKLQFQYLVDK
jgi:hypothetical protein